MEQESPEVWDEPLSPVDGTGGVGREKDDVADIFAQGKDREDAGLAIAEGVDQAKGNEGKAQPAQIKRRSQHRILAG